MVVLADTSGIISLLDQSAENHVAAVKAITDEHIWVPSTTLPEVDYLVTKYLGERVAQAFLDALLSGDFLYRAVELQDIQRALELMRQYKDVPLGVVDTSIVALAERYKIAKILTLDRRHFSLIQPRNLPYLELLP